MKRLFTLLVLISLASSNALLASETKRPNIILIMADDLGYGDISPYKGWINTPHLTQFAKEGMRFTDFHSNGAVCSPTRAALLTGRYQQRAGIPGVVFADPKRPEHEHGLQPQETTFAELVRQSGYQTGMVGKWHLGYYPRYNPIRQGFGFYRGYVSGNVDYFSHVDQAGNLDWWQQDKLKDEPGYVTHLITKHAIRFIEDNKNRPFCLYIAHEAPHYPYQGPDDSALRKVGQPRSKKELKMPYPQRKIAYREMVDAMDKSIGKVLATLKKLDLDENTLVIFISDNGATRLGSNGPLRGYKGTLWEGGHRVPAIFRWPGHIPPGTTNDSLVLSMDILPTMVSLTKSQLPKRQKVDGIDLSNVLLKKQSIKNRTVFWAHGNNKAVRQKSWVLLQRGKKKVELYNLDQDLEQKNDLKKRMPQRVADMTRLIRDWVVEMKRSATKQPNQ